MMNDQKKLEQKVAALIEAHGLTEAISIIKDDGDDPLLATRQHYPNGVFVYCNSEQGGMLVGSRSHDNRARLTIEQPGKPRLYQPTRLTSWEIIGTVTRGESDTGALVRNLETGIYAQANAGAIRSLDQRKVKAALGEPSNAKKLNGGRRVNVYLDGITLERAEALGGGNISEGIRRALELASDE